MVSLRMASASRGHFLLTPGNCFLKKSLSVLETHPQRLLGLCSFLYIGYIAIFWISPLPLHHNAPMMAYILKGDILGLKCYSSIVDLLDTLSGTLGEAKSKSVPDPIIPKCGPKHYPWWELMSIKLLPYCTTCTAYETNSLII